jgi:hypothetical protein
MAGPDITGMSAVARFLSSPTAMEVLHVPDRRSHPAAQFDTGWARRIPVGNPPIKPRLKERQPMVAWSESTREVEVQAMWSQLWAERARMREAEDRRIHRKEMWLTALAGVAGVAVAVALVALRWVLV